VISALSESHTPVIYIPGGLTGYYQPLDVGINMPLKHWIREENTHQNASQHLSPEENRKLLIDAFMHGWESLSRDLIINSFNHMLIATLDEDDVTEVQLVSEIE
jgi:hypothetical protein